MAKAKRMNVRVIKEKTSKAETTTQTTQNKVGIGGWLDPAYDQLGVKRLVDESTIVPQCIRAYKNNIAGFGIGVKYKEDIEETPEMAAEFTKAKKVIELLNIEQDTKEVFEDIIEARETYGVAYLEIIRNIADEVVQIEFIKNTPSIRRTEALEPYISSVYYYNGEEVERKKKYCKYRQKIGSKEVYFKEFGDPRIMNRETGEYLSDGETLDINLHANEILDFPIGTSPYGEIRWLGQVLGIDGSRKAENLNNNYFKNGRHTPLLIMIEGGTLSDDSFTKLQGYMNEIKGEEGQHSFIVLETESVDGRADFDQADKPKIEIKDLASVLQKDELFQDYLNNNRRKVQSAFQLPDLYVGYTTDFNRATAQTAQEVTEQQVFQPERKSLAWVINNRLLNGYNFKYVEAYFLAPKTNNPDDLAKIIGLANSAGGLTPNKAKQIAYEALGEVSEDYTEPWGEIPIAIQTIQGQQAAGANMGQMFMALQKQITKAESSNDDKIVSVLKEVKKLLQKNFTSDTKKRIIKDNWNEDDHPRDESGKFTGGGGSGGASVDTTGTTAKTAESSTGIIFNIPKAENFMNQLSEAKASQPADSGWRVDDYSHTVEDYSKDKLFSTEGGSTVAVTPDGDIISVCGKVGDSVRGSDLLQMAVEQGGKKLDAFSGLYGFYRKSGFEPVSWCEFNKDYAPPGWKEGRDAEEPIIFWKYTGNKATESRSELESEMSSFLLNTTGYTGETGYDDAMNERDNAL